jgi:Flp pilus assembly pilin Flp
MQSPVTPPIWGAQNGYAQAGSRASRPAFHRVESMEPAQSRYQPAQALVEFGLLLALVAVVAIGSLLLFGSTVGDLISTLSHTVSVNINP